MSPSMNMHDLAMRAEWNRWFYAIGAAYHNQSIGRRSIYLWILQKISGTSGKNHFYKMNGDVGMAGW